MIELTETEGYQLNVFIDVIRHSRLLYEAYIGLPEEERDSIDTSYLQSLRNGQIILGDEVLLNKFKEDKTQGGGNRG